MIDELATSCNLHKKILKAKDVLQPNLFKEMFKWSEKEDRDFADLVNESRHRRI
jgi:hypothetical protein